MKWQNMGTKGKALLIVAVALLAVTGVWFGWRAPTLHRVAQRTDHALADAGYTKRTVRRRVYKEATGPSAASPGTTTPLPTRRR
ncbi:hypothetical protein [Lacticaseibacillus kribbianus]|uniref:hypothetical protein n=1 Tax=Lacticaseibacillus kribbianus TaxID=2926292 RepID=UPI001CD1BFE9|nr:hypothetical protein [Lacticaseibacillus kribbianus]